ncbi:MAG: T9SS type A sorting domain-containing protein [Ignavibacteriae bacterium]|nr:T9SS type A sorting domain-containing protein [Ignavibacteriota bacterium]
MKKYFFVFFIIFYLSIYCYSQTGWFLLNTNTTQALRSIYFINPSTGFVGGSTGTVFKTTDSGNNWVPYSCIPGNTIFSVLFLNENTGFIAGVGGKISKSTNGGINWISNLTGTTEFLNSLFFTDSLTGYCVGRYGTILKTTNCGLNWVSKTSPSPDLHFNSVFFTSIDTGYSTGELGKVIKTVDGGNNWNLQTINSSYNFYQIYFINKSTGYIIGDVLIKTTNSGNNWNILNSQVFGVSIYFTNPQTGYITGGFGQLYKSTNSGVNWVSQNLSFTNYLYRVFFTDINTGYVCGSSGTIFKTITGGLVDIEKSVYLLSEYNLYQNYPNPFNSETKIKFYIKESEFTSLKIFGINGKEIKTLINKKLTSGVYNIDFNGNDLPSGIYFYRLSTKKYSETKKMLLIK